METFSGLLVGDVVKDVAAFRVPKSCTELEKKTVIFTFLSEMFSCQTCQKAFFMWVFFLLL